MSCMRCGKETDEGQVFCTECLEDAERHPIKPGTPVQLPKRRKHTAPKRTGFKMAASKWQDKIFRLKYTIFWLVLLIVLLVAAIILGVCILLQITPQWLNELFFGKQDVQSWIASIKP